MKKDVLQGYRLSPQQRHLWELLRRGRDESYQVKCAVTIKGPLKVRHLKTAAQNVVARHEILRTTFQCLPGMTVPIQVIEEGCGVIWKSEDISEQDDRALLIEARFHHPAQEFNFEQGPVLNIHLIKRAKHDHVMILRLPAICADAVSLRNLVGVLSRGYAAAVCGEALDGDVMQYVDLAEWQNELIEAEETRIGREYWHSQNLSAPAALQLAFEGRPAVEAAFEPGLDELEIAPPLTARLESLARGAETSLDRILLACWYVLLWRHTGQPEIKVGAAFDGRRSSEIEDAVGLFAKYLPVTCQLEEELRFGALVEQLEQALLTVRGKQEYFSWEQFVEPSASVARTPFLPFCFEPETTLPTFLADGVSFTIFKHYACIDRFKIKLTYLCRSNRPVVEFHYDLELFRSADIRCLMGHFQALLENLTANPMAKIGELEMVTESERRQLLAGYNSTKTEWPQDQFVHELFLKQVERTPEAVAVTYGNEQLTYREVNDRAARLAHYLCGLGVGPEVIAGVSMERSPDLIIALLAVLKAGGAYLPLDPSYPKERLAFMLGDAAVKLLLTQAHLRSRLPAAEQVVFVDAMWGTVLQTPALDCKTALSPDNLAYVIYTSGSTGKPKGVMLRHQSLKNYLMWAVSHYPVEAGCGAPVHTSLSFDLTITSLFTPLLAGGYVHLLPTENEIESLGTALSEGRGYGLVKLTPAHLQLLAEQLAGVNLNGAARSLVIGGENLPAPAVKWWRDRAAQTRLFNEYGPTESVVGCCVYEVGADLELEEARATVPIGRPIANTRLYILDERLQPTPQGIVGELCIGGEGLARGYLNLSSSTAERFVPDPYSGETGARLYRTGDLARYLRDGQIECLGRMDGQVKVRGFRIELGEVEAVLRDIPGVREAVVAVVSEGGRNSLIGYVVGDEGRKPDVSQLLQYLHERLPEYMLPSALLALDALPLNENGKIDRKILPSLKEAGRQPGRAYVGPRNQVEEILAGIFEEVLRVEGVGVTDNFFEIGGHSLLATQVISRVRKTFGVEIGVKSIFKDATIESLASRIEAAMRAGEKDEAPPLVRIDRESCGGGKFPPSFAQRRLWFIDNLDPGNVVYNMPGAVRLEGRLDLDALESVINEIVRRHEVLRTRFEVEDGEAVQVIDAWEPRRLEVIDLTRLTRETREEEVRRVASEEAWTEFDLSRGPLLRVKVLKLGEEEQVLFFTMHHIVSDGWSMGIMIREVGELYQAYSRGETSPLAELPIQYADFAVWQRKRMEDKGFDGQLDYWIHELAGAPGLDLPTDLPRSATSSYAGARETFVLSGEVTQRLKEVSRRQGVTLFMNLLASFQLLLARYAGQDRVAVGFPIAGRNLKETEPLIGFFVNTLVIMTDLSGNPTVRDLLHRVREKALGAYAHQEAPFEKLVEELQPERSLNRHPLFQVMLVYQNYPMRTLELPGLTISAEPVSRDKAIFDLTLTFLEDDGLLYGSLEYSSDLYERGSIQRLLGHFRRTLDGIVGDQESRVMDIPILTEQERRQLAEWNGAAAMYPAGKCIHEMFEEQADLTPDAIAAVCGTREISYRELNRRANQVGSYLRSLGVRTEIKVGLYIERSLEMLVGLLGVLKAGGAYVPLDPAYPAERLELLLKNAAAPFILTEEKFRSSLQAPYSQLIFIDGDYSEISNESEENIKNEIVPDNLAYVIYTSGSTGNPKGALLTHRSIVNFAADAARKFDLGSDSRFLQFASISFDVMVEEIFPAWLSGGAVVLPSDNLLYSYSELLRILDLHRVTIIELPTAYWAEWIGELSKTRTKLPGSLKTVIIGGERVAPEILAQWQTHDVRLKHVYGLTEAAVTSTVYVVPNEVGAVASFSEIPIGRPMANTEIHLLNDGLQTEPVCVPGEIYVGGVGLARGYLDQPDVTASKFIPCPFGEASGSRMYKTGDLARRLVDGDIEFNGRVDHQIKIHGHRVEPGEIESVLMQSPAVKQCVVIAREIEPGDKRLVAYLVLEEEVAATVIELRAFLRQKLPAYLTPSFFVVLQSFPISPNGKVDRRALPIPSQSDIALELMFVAPRNPIEEELARIFGEVLGIERVGIHDNFFDLGGHSLLVTQAVSRINRAFQIEISLRDLFDAPTVSGIVPAIVQNQIGQAEGEDLSQLLADLESLSEIEIESELGN